MSSASSLFSRLSVLFTLILAGLGSLVWFIAHQSQQRYFEETTQQLNRPVAMYIAEQIPLFVNGHYDHHALADLAKHVMIINPNLELYLLDTDGRVVASAAGEEPEKSMGMSVDLEPIQDFLNTTDQIPIYGDDPKVPGQSRIFSAYPLSDSGIGTVNCSPCGYVYAVLGGQQFVSGIQALKASQTLQFATLMLLAVLLCALLAGLVIFFMLTKPLRAMTESIARWQLVASEIQKDALPRCAVPMNDYANELQALESTCHAMAKRLSMQYVALDDADRHRRQLLTSLSHDLRTPLTSVCGALETLMARSKNLSVGERAGYLNVAHRQSLRLHRLIDQVFELARLDSGDVSLELEPVSFQELAMDTVQELAPHAARKGVTLQFIPGDTKQEPLVNGDLGQLNRVLVNLLSNAIRYTPKNGKVMVRTHLDADKKMMVSISDSGCGFADVLENQPLSTIGLISSAHTKASQTGTGLGLGIVSRILALHGSEATVCSSPGQGARVRFALDGVVTGSRQIDQGV